MISLGYWVFGQSLGGPFWVGNATDVNAGPLFVLLAVALFPIAQRPPAAQPATTTDTPGNPIEAAGANTA